MLACVVDGADDCGVDFISRQGGVVVIIQAKYSGVKKQSKRPKEDPRHLRRLSPFIGRLFQGPKAYRISAKLREAVADINWDQDAFRLYYVTLQQTAENAPAIEEQGITPVVDLPDLQERTTLELLDEKGLNVALRDALTLEEGNSTPVSIRFSSDSDEKPWLHYLDEDGREPYVGRVNGTQLAEILRAHKSQLFALNIRNYVGDNVTNKAIRKTATSNPNCFYYYNNGISALATRIELDQ